MKRMTIHMVIAAASVVVFTLAGSNAAVAADGSRAMAQHMRLMASGNPGMVRMMELMASGNPGMAAMMRANPFQMPPTHP